MDYMSKKHPKGCAIMMSGHGRIGYDGHEVGSEAPSRTLRSAKTEGDQVNRRRSFLATAAGFALAVGLGSAHAADQVSLTIGKLLELTGPLSEAGPSQDKAVSVAIDYANQAAAAAGVPIKATAVSADAQGDPQAALSAARALVAKGASAIIGPSITPESIAIANGLTIQKRITLWPTGTSMRLRTIKDEGTIFRTVPPDI